MIARAALWVLLLFPCASWAQDVSIRSGEHADFSRLVLDFDSRVTWQFGRVEGGYELRVSTPEVQFDLSRIFALIPRTRVQSVEDRGEGRLFIASSCDCHGDAFDLRASEVVLDIKDGAAPHAASPFNQTLPTLSAARQADPVDAIYPDEAVAVAEDVSPEPIIMPQEPREARAGLPITFGFGTPLPQAASQADPELSVQPTEPVAEALGDESAPADPPVDPSADAAGDEMAEGTSTRVSETEEALLRQIGRAAAQGLLEADLEATEAAVEAALDPVPEPEPQSAPTEVEAAVPETPSDPTEHLRIQTVIDRDLGLSETADAPRTHEGETCLSAEHFDIASWGVPPTDGADLSVYRAGLLGEFDKANSDHVLGLVRNYIYLTFGAEAIAVARRYEADLRRPDLLIMMGEIMDHGESSLPAAVVEQMACQGPVALWAALAQPELAPAADIDRGAVIKSFSALPLHLRRHLGPGLSRKFLDIGDVATANALRDAVARAPGNHGAGFDLLEARLDRSNGDATRADDRLDEIINADGPIAPEALLSLIEARAATGAPIDARLRELATSMAYEHRGTDMGATLLGLAIETEARAARFDEAFVLLEEARATYGADAAGTKALYETFLIELAEAGDDATFLTHAVSEIEQIQALPASVRRVVAGRLLDLGFAGSARISLSHPNEIPGPEDRVLFARVALLEGQAGVAMGYLAGLDDPAAVRLRARAQSALADHEGAASSWAQLDEEQARWDAAWLAGDWELLEHAKGTHYQEVAQIMLQDRLEEAAQDGLPEGNAMSRGQDALSQSQRIRSTLSNLLEGTGTP